MNRRVAFGVMLAFGIASVGLAQSGWKTYADMDNRCQVSVPADWGRGQGELFIRDSSRQMRALVGSSMSRMQDKRAQVRSFMGSSRFTALQDTPQRVVYRYQGSSSSQGDYVGYYVLYASGSGTCKLHKTVPAELAPMFDDVVQRIAATLRAR